MSLRSCRQGKGLFVLPFFPLHGEVGDLFRVPGERRPYHINRISRRTPISAPIHPMIAFQMTDNRLDLDPLLGRPPEPTLFAVRMEADLRQDDTVQPVEQWKS